MDSSLQVFLPLFCTQFLSLPCVLHAPLISSSLICFMETLYGAQNWSTPSPVVSNKRSLVLCLVYIWSASVSSFSNIFGHTVFERCSEESTRSAPYVWMLKVFVKSELSLPDVALCIGPAQSILQPWLRNFD